MGQITAPMSEVIASRSKERRIMGDEHGSQTAILLTTYTNNSSTGANLATSGYSYDFVVSQFKPLLEQCGELTKLPPNRVELERAIAQARGRNLKPVHVCIMSFQHACLTDFAPNIIVPAWEYPDVPNHEFGGDPRNDWVSMGNRCSSLIVGGPWTEAVFRRAGINPPIHVVPVPNRPEYFDVPSWEPGQTTRIDCKYVECTPRTLPLPSKPARNAPPPESPSLDEMLRGASFRGRAWQEIKDLYYEYLCSLLPRRLESTMTAGLRGAVRGWSDPTPRPVWQKGLELSGIVFTSIFNPEDGRKNWQDLLSGFIQALGDCGDATLVLKLIARNKTTADDVLKYYQRLGVQHRCRIVIVTDFLSQTQMTDLANASAFYVTSTRAEGNCLPLMDYLAAGRPAIAPRHTAITDYFRDQMGFVVDSHPEPTSWPQDPKQQFRTTWQRLDWSSLVRQLQQGFFVAKHSPAEYQQMALTAQSTMRNWSHPQQVLPRLSAALQSVVASEAAKSASWYNPGTGGRRVG